MSENKEIHERFLLKLQEKYGEWSKATSHFGRATYGTIAKELSISASQFSKLIYGTATEGMYIRSIENINRLLRREALQSEHDQAIQTIEALEDEVKTLREDQRLLRWKFFIFSCIGVIGVIAGWCYLRSGTPISVTSTSEHQHPLSDFFDRRFDEAFQSPYLSLSEVQDYCPCSAYEGKWELSASYKLPLPVSRKPGVYYLAKSADVRMRCMRYDISGHGLGTNLAGYEHLVNEIWVDTDRTPLSPEYFDKESKRFTQKFNDLDFEHEANFKKVATIHSFFVDVFTIYPDSIVRRGEPCGRYVSDYDEDLAEEHHIDLQFILQNVLVDLSPTNCATTINPYCDPNQLSNDESEIVFDCIYTISTENLGIGGGYPYTKGYRLIDQIYADNLTCSCDDLRRRQQKSSIQQ